ncbi:PfkB family carbohydrate kinase [Litoreibacter janthinus]|uniref:Sugar or nucleoside kinase, ribokinase family n=1 Tax=Litoreibacter janthinus TaxID=670154 RepID=A0A1I6H5S0_9RHOB|nr:PfkB family carbohydrate kinase [Litoreibacter janthinus]SFR49768.1 Sugar or nucleoside kinase, ribokinase family [Litoreibacter janthinus]
MSKTPDILCIGAVLWDIIGRHDNDMERGHDRPGRITRVPGGVAMNIAMALQAYGMTPALLTAIGRDAEGDELLRSCADMGMITDHIYRPHDLPTDRYMAIEGRNGLIAAIADAHSLEQAGDAILTPMSRALQGWTGLVGLDGNLTVDLLSQIASDEAFAKADLRLAPASPGKAERLRPFLSHPTATLYVNLEEAGLLLDTTFQDSATAATALLSKGLHRALVTNGAEAASLALGNKLLTFTPPKVEVKRITGAGDTFMAAHISAEATGATPETALQNAMNATATYISGDSY